MGGVGKKPKKNSCKGKCQEKKFVQEEGKEKKFVQREGPTPGPAILILIINKDWSVSNWSVSSHCMKRQI